MHSADKLAEMRTKFHVIQAKLIMSVWCFTVQWTLSCLRHLSVVRLVLPSPEPPLLTAEESNSIRRFVITEKAPTRAFSWLKAATTAFTFKTLLRHYAKQALTPRSLNVKLGPRRNYHKGRAAIRHYANQTARPL